MLSFASTGSVQGDQFNYFRRSALLSQNRLYDPSIALRSDPDIYDKVLRDPVIAHAIRFRKFLVAGSNWSIEPASEDEDDKKLGAIVEKLIRKAAGFST